MQQQQQHVKVCVRCFASALQTICEMQRIKVTYLSLNLDHRFPRKEWGSLKVQPEQAVDINPRGV